MTHFKKKTFFENKYSLNKLNEFLNLIEKYFGTVGWNYKEPIIYHTEVRNLRTRINKLVPILDKIILESDVPAYAIYTSPPMTGSRKTHVDIISNIFNLHSYKLTPQMTIDLIERAIGVYSTDKISSIIRTINPLFWFTKCMDQIFSIPLYLLTKAGFQEAVTNSVGMKLFRFIFNLSVFIASTLTILHLLGWLENLKLLIQTIK